MGSKNGANTDFAEPGWFLVTPDFTIRSLSISSSPAGGRVWPDQFEMLLEWNDSRSAADGKYAASIQTRLVALQRSSLFWTVQSHFVLV